jgi:TolB-like protein
VRSRVGLLLATLLVAAGVVLAVRHLTRHERERVVVAVFVNRTRKPELETFGRMVADWLNRGLQRTGTVEVVDLGVLYVQGRQAGGQPTGALELARSNGAGSVVAGSYYLADDTLVIRSVVLDVGTGEVSQTVAPVRVQQDQSLHALELLQQYVMTAAAGALDIELRPFSAQRDPPKYDAYQAFVAAQIRLLARPRRPRNPQLLPVRGRA